MIEMLDQVELERHLIKHLTSSKEVIEMCLSRGIEARHFLSDERGDGNNMYSKFFELITNYYKVNGLLFTEMALETYLIEKGVKDKARSKILATWSSIQDIDIDENDFGVVVKLIKDRYCMVLFRQMFEDGKDSLNEGDLQSTNNTIQDYVNVIQDELNEFKIEKQTLDITNAVDYFVSEYKKREENPDFYMGIPSGLNEIDSQTFGWMGGQLNVIIAPTSGGKSVQLLNMAKAAHKHKKNVLYFSFEMNLWLCLLRHLSLYFEVPFSQIKQIALNSENLTKIIEGLEALHGENYFLYDVNIDDPTPEYVESRIREMINTKGKPDIIICDYIGNMHSRTSRKEAKDWERASDAGLALFKIARRYNIVILTAQQVNRESVKEIKKNKEGGKVTTLGQDAVSGAQSLLHYAYYAIALEPDRDNNITWYHPVKMRDARFQPFCTQCIPEFNKIEEMSPDEQEKWSNLRRVETGTTEARKIVKTNFDADTDNFDSEAPSANIKYEEPTPDADLFLNDWMADE